MEQTSLILVSLKKLAKGLVGHHQYHHLQYHLHLNHCHKYHHRSHRKHYHINENSNENGANQPYHGQLENACERVSL